MAIIRVFPARTSYTPNDYYAFVGMPPMKEYIPEHDEIHISCTFTWDKALCEDLAYQWESQTNKPVKIGGPAYESPVEGFTPGMYVHKNIVFTTRGCNNNCPWCCVPKREGKLKELPICPGNIIQDNNFLQASKPHKDKVFEMLKKQNKAIFKGGIEADLIDDHFINGITSLKHLPELWLACDTDGALPQFKKACERLIKAGYNSPGNKDKIRCYALIGDDMEKNEDRLREIYHAGAIPSAQLYRDFSDAKTEYSAEWNAFERTWQRPAGTKAHMKAVDVPHGARTYRPREAAQNEIGG